MSKQPLQKLNPRYNRKINKKLRKWVILRTSKNIQKIFDIDTVTSKMSHVSKNIIKQISAVFHADSKNLCYND